MKTRKLIATAAMMLATTMWLTAAQTNTELFNFVVANGVVPDANYSGFADTHLITVTNPVSVISDLRVTLNISGGYNGDLYAYLVHGSGFAVLLNRVGRTSGNLFGYGDAGLNLTLSDSAAGDIHLYGGNGGSPLTGVWQPDGRNVAPTTVLDTNTRNALLGSFTGLSANGLWTLFVADFAVGDQSTLQSWGLQITTIPEPAIGALGILAGAIIGLRILLFPSRRRPRK